MDPVTPSAAEAPSGVTAEPPVELLVISDLHLGESLGGPKTEPTLRLEQALIGFLDHHRLRPGRKRLVVNGDMIELSALNVSPADVGPLQGLHPDDQEYGLGGSEQAAVAKLGLVLLHHRDVFGAFGRFLASGHLVSIVIGNHDVELHWPAVQELLSRTVLDQAVAHGGDRGQLRDAFTFHPWFFLEEGMAWIEHGHQYDPYCSFEEVLEPATDETEIDPNLGGLLPRYVGPRMGEALQDDWNRTFFSFLAFWAVQGRTRLAGIVRAYFDVWWRMLGHWRARRPDRIAARRDRVVGRLRALALRVRVSEEALREVAALAKSPVSVDLRRIVQALMLDRLVLMVLGPVLLLGPLVLPWAWAPYGLGLAAIPIAVGFGFALIAREPVDPTDAMRHSAREIRRRLRVPFVVMGHTHQPLAEVDGRGGFLNTGHWVPARDGAVTGGDRDQAFTHVLIQRTESGVRAVLCQWRDGVSKVYHALQIRSG